MNDYTYRQVDRFHRAAGRLGGMEQMAEGMLNYNPFLERLMIAPYIKGEAFIRYLMDQGGTDLVSQAFQNPPQSMTQIMHPEKYYPTPDVPSIVETPDLSSALPGWSKETEDTLGELIIGTMFELVQGDAAAGEKVAAGWDGDRLSSWRYRRTTISRSRG